MCHIDRPSRRLGAVRKHSVDENDILRLQRWLGAGDSVEYGSGGDSGHGAEAADGCGTSCHLVEFKTSIRPKRDDFLWQ